MDQAKFVIPAEVRLDSKTITANGTAQDVELTAEANLVKVTSVAGITMINTKGTVADSDGDWDVYIPEGGDLAFTVREETTLSVIGGGEVRISSFG